MESVPPHLHSGCISSRNSTSARTALSPAFVQQTDLFVFPRQGRVGVRPSFTWFEHFISLLHNSIHMFPPALTITVDSYFWNRYPLWPEFSGIYFNVVEGKSAEWGVRAFFFRCQFSSSQFLPIRRPRRLPISPRICPSSSWEHFPCLRLELSLTSAYGRCYFPLWDS